MQALKDAFNHEYESTVGQYSFSVPKDLTDMVEARIKAAQPNVGDTTLDKVSRAVAAEMERFSDGLPTIDGNNLLNAKNSVSGLYKQMRGPERSALNHAVGVFDDIIESELSPTVQGQADLARYQNLSEPYQTYKDVGKAVGKAQVEVEAESSPLASSPRA